MVGKGLKDLHGEVSGECVCAGMQNQGAAAQCCMFLWPHGINTMGKVGRIHDAAPTKSAGKGRQTFSANHCYTNLLGRKCSVRISRGWLASLEIQLQSVKCWGPRMMCRRGLPDKTD